MQPHSLGTVAPQVSFSFAHGPQSTIPSQPSGIGPHCPSTQPCGTHVPLPHSFGVPSPPQLGVAGGHVPQSMKPPQPSAIGPQLVGEQLTPLTQLHTPSMHCDPAKQSPQLIC